MNPFFSIIIPTYNRAHTIRRPIDSIIAQTFTDWELIIVDDGSTDATQEIIETYKDPRIRYVWQENQERSAARNLGIRLATGGWICFQDSDDEYLPEHLEVLFEGIQNHPEYKVIRTGLLIYENGKLVGKSAINPSKYDQYPFECIQVYGFNKSVLNSVIFNPKIFIAEDLHFLIKIGLNYKILVIEKWTGNYFYNPESSGGVGRNYERNLNNKILCLDDIFTWNKSLVISFVIRQRCLTELLLLSGHFGYQRNKILFGFVRNIIVFFRFPLEYIKLIIRIVYVKIGESSGLYRTQGRF